MGRQDDQARAMDITRVPTARGFAHLAPVPHRHSRRVPAHRVAVKVGAGFCGGLRPAAAGPRHRMNEERGLPTASVVRPPQATPDPCRGRP